MRGLNSESCKFAFRKGSYPEMGEDTLKEGRKVHHIARLFHHIQVAHHVHVSMTQGMYPRRFTQEDGVNLRGRVVPSQRVDARMNE